MERSALLLLLAFILTLPAIGQQQPKPQYGTDLGALVALPTGKSAELWKTGYGAQAGMFYDFEESFRFAASIGFVYTGLDGDAVRRKIENADKGTSDVQGSTSGFPLILSLRLLTPGPSMRFYGALEGGLYLYSSKIEGSYTQKGGTRIVVDDSEFRSEPGFNAAIGVLSPIGQNLYLDINARYHFVKDSEYFSSNSWGNTVGVSTTQYFSIGVGVSYSYDI